MMIAMKSSYALCLALILWMSGQPVALGQVASPEKPWHVLLQGGFLVPVPSPSDPGWQPLLGMNLRVQAQCRLSSWFSLRGGVQYNLPQIQVQSFSGQERHWVYLHQLGVPIEGLLQLPTKQRWQGYLGAGIMPRWNLHSHTEINPTQGSEVLAKGKADLRQLGTRWRPVALLGLRRWLPEQELFSSLELRWQPRWQDQALAYLGTSAYLEDQILFLHWISLNLGMGF